MSVSRVVRGPWTRSPRGVIAGVCEGMGKELGVDPALLRIAFIASVFFGGTGLLLYLVMWWLLPLPGEVPVEPSTWPTGSDGRHVPPFARTLEDKKILGVCGGLARRWQVDSTLVRLATLGLAVASAGIAIVVYLVMAVIMPSNEQGRYRDHPVEL